VDYQTIFCVFGATALVRSRPPSSWCL